MWDAAFAEGWNADVEFVAADGQHIPALSKVLAFRSGVFREFFDSFAAGGRRRPPVCRVVVEGHPAGAVRTFVRFLYSSQYEEADMREHLLSLVELAHLYRVPTLLAASLGELRRGPLGADLAVGGLQLARRHGLPELECLCKRFVVEHFKQVVRRRSWQSMKESDPELEMELLEARIEADAELEERARAKRRRVAAQLRDSLDALLHVCRDSCQSLGGGGGIHEAFPGAEEGGPPGAGGGGQVARPRRRGFRVAGKRRPLLGTC